MPKRAKKSRKSSTPVESIVHKEDHRTNIPTAELETFMKSDDRQPKKALYRQASELLYPRDPAADPQLVWRGKDAQDRQPLEVAAPPIYIQEKAHPKAIIETLRAEKRNDAPGQVDLFSDFNGIQFDELVDFYKHEQNWSNRIILGDSLQVMASLGEREGLKGQVQCVYFDPPYGIKFGSNWQVSTRRREVRDGHVEDASRQPEQVRAFRDTWELGIHSYLSYLRDRLAVARELLNGTGSIFVQIGDENVHLVRSVMDEVFGVHNFCSQISYKTAIGMGSRLIDGVAHFLLWYAKDGERVKYHPLYKETTIGGEGASRYTHVESPDGLHRRLMTLDEREDPSRIPTGWRVFRDQGLTSRSGSATTSFTVDFEGKEYVPSSGGWRTSAAGMRRLILAGRVIKTGKNLSYKKFWDDFPAVGVANFWEDTGGGITSRSDPKIYVVQTSNKIVERCILMTSDPGDLVLDPTCGSGTTAYVSEEWGRRWITVDTSRVALTLTRQRLVSAKFPYYLPVSPQGDLRRGFRYRSMPYVTLKSIANNSDIHEGMSREAIDRTIAKHAESQTLYDQPESDKSIVRVAGPFTVDSLSPLLPGPAIEGDHGDSRHPPDDAARNFETVIMDNLRRAGVQNTVRQERLTFLGLQPWAGRFIHAIGQYNENDQTKRAAICIGPQYGTVDADLVRDAAKEAAGYFDILIVCGFAFDAYIANEVKQLGNLTILKASMNPDLSMGGDLLKKTGTGNLFTVFGEPDIQVRHNASQLVVEIRGLDVFDPTTGAIRSHTTDDIACWFIDTDYNAESFFIRHAYFTGANDPYTALKRALKADIDEQAWASLNSTTSRPFPIPTTGRIAVKVINHYGDEVMKVYPIAEEMKYPVIDRRPLLRAAEPRPKR